MDADNPLDRHLATVGARLPDEFRAVSTHMADLLDLAWLTAQSVFRDQARPEHAIALLPQLIVRVDEERRLREEERRQHLAGY